MPVTLFNYIKFFYSIIDILIPQGPNTKNQYDERAVLVCWMGYPFGQSIIFPEEIKLQLVVGENSSVSDFALLLLESA